MTRSRSRWWDGLDAAMAAFSLWLASGRQMQFLDATFDDRLFARLANSLRDGNWLGAYDKLTLVKGPGFPAFLAATSAAGIPLRLAEQGVYLLGCWLVARAVGRLSPHRWLGSLVFAVAALNPVVWGISMDRIVRENLYLGLTVVVLGLAMRVLLVPGAVRDLGRTLPWGIALGLAFGWFWLTREEGIWLVPPLALLALDWLARRWRGWPPIGRAGYVGRCAAVVLVPVLAFAAVDLGVMELNRRAYGVRETNDFRSAEFRAAYGALSRIEHAHWQRLIPVPRDARAAAYAASPAARELAPRLEGRSGTTWQEVGCSWLPITPCNDIQSGWFMWALRDAADEAQHHGSAGDARRFYARIAAEVNAACDAGTLRCLPRRSGFMPPMRREYLPFVAEDAWQLGKLLATLGGEAPGDACSEDSPEAIAAFRRVAIGPWTPGGAACSLGLRGDVEILGWVFAPAGPVTLRAVAAGGDTLALAPAPDVPTALQAPGGVAQRFRGTIHCGDSPCSIVAEAPGGPVTTAVSSLAPGYAVNTAALRVWIDSVAPAATFDVQRPQRGVATIVSAALRAAWPVLLPVAVLVALALALLDWIGARRLQKLTTLWLVLLAAMGMRVGLLAVLNATSLPAIAPLYLSPAIGLALLFTAGVLGDAAIRLAARRRGAV